MTEFDEMPTLRHGPARADIIAWGADNGFEPLESGRMARGLRAAFLEAHPGAFARPAEDGSQGRDDGFLTEVAPKVGPERTPAARAKGFLERRAAKTPAAKRKHPRVSTENIIEGFWSVLAMVAKPISAPTARMLMLEAPVAGMILDDKIRGTLVDKVLQPLARTEDSGKSFMGLLAPPLLVLALEKHPDKANQIYPLLRKSLIWHAEMAGPKLEERMRRESEIEEKYGESIDDMLMTIFGAETETPET
jgi:hypothetical protein